MMFSPTYKMFTKGQSIQPHLLHPLSTGIRK